MSALDCLLVALRQRPCVLVRVDHTRGSVPREAGAWMAVFAQDTLDTIGGGRLEQDAILHARRLLAGQEDPTLVRYALGPSLGQCCGGEVHLRYDLLPAGEAPSWLLALQQHLTPVALFGGGHVGRALVQVLSMLPMRITWIDSREAIFPEAVPAQVQCEHSEPVQSAVATLAPQSRVLIMSFSHAEDLDIVAACLHRLRLHNDLPYIGLIGSKTKWATFQKRLSLRGYSEAELARITCPIGVPGIHDKRPEVIAVAVAAQLLQQQEAGLH